ncbi:hypothetical protein ACKUB1_04255 [Methanospirillum stamsii]|uniref:Uncharacterized protein n=1 Tax=Methanospirillum stamsii TaxID=1277351 RepID=A0A2V2NE74_9EURY|nr:hypothetical protein [Methanospirillum stamsii]PWR73613.1 hypothetical protein DLD82_10315 [Methanospirillum stamsii]
MTDFTDMRVIQRKNTNKCTDEYLVSEFTFSHPIDTKFLSILKKQGTLSVRSLGELQMFTFHEGEWLTMKGMTGDTILYVTHPKTEKNRVEERINFYLDLYLVIEKE